MSAGHHLTLPYRIAAPVPQRQYNTEQRQIIVAAITELVLDAELGAYLRDPSRVWVFTPEIRAGTWGEVGCVFTHAEIVGLEDQLRGRAHAEKVFAERRGELACPPRYSPRLLANSTHQPSYGNDDHTAHLQQIFTRCFGETSTDTRFAMAPAPMPHQPIVRCRGPLFDRPGHRCRFDDDPHPRREGRSLAPVLAFLCSNPLVVFDNLHG
ncbi:hypothetical protein AB0C34_14830 [Nocardia sp. NPDC049220]|uniref:hypothetical protein n=1 Tax=Nocardia sp. NPDC049220 TaxID=3155273 RepID=UPI0033CEA22F